ncbi:phage major tail tube protein [Escherichia coli]|nr:phage major tail tube protein [Escherichia coli]WNS26977.1 phage major tail tube protein [Escherichia coli]
MALPRKLKHLNLFNDGNNWQGIVESLTLPKFTRKYEKYRGGGMPGAVDVDLGLDDSALDTEFSIGGTELLLFKQMGKGGEAIVSRAATVPPVYRIEAPTQIIIQTQPGQSAQDIAREVARQLDERERRLKAKARSNYSDQGGYDA